MKLTQEQKTTLKKAKILIFDLEVSPMLAYTYNYYEGNVLKVVEPQKLLCFSYKWLGDDGDPKVVNLIDGSVDPKNDKWITKQLWNLLNEANYAVAHNGGRFDAKMANTFFVAHGMTPPSPYKMIDTLTAARQKFKFPSNKLDELGKFLEVGKKTEVTCGDLWESCLNGDKKAYKLMAKYCANDVALLESVYWKVMPFAPSVNINKTVNEEMVCPICGSTHFVRKGFVPDAAISPSWEYECEECHCKQKVLLTKEEKEEFGFVKPLNKRIAGCF